MSFWPPWTSDAQMLLASSTDDPAASFWALRAARISARSRFTLRGSSGRSARDGKPQLASSRVAQHPDGEHAANRRVIVEPAG